MKKEVLEEIVFGESYYSIDDLRYNQKVGYMLSKENVNELLAYKEQLAERENEYIKVLPLKTFNSKHCFYVSSVYLLSQYNAYLRAFVDDFRSNETTLTQRNAKELMTSRVFSEVEGTLNIENVPTTHKRIKEVFSSENLTDKNDIIIKNMQKAIIYILNEQPAFNKENLYKLYCILSKDCLGDNEQLRKGRIYRDDVVYVGGFAGAPEDKIDEMMNSLFDFVNDKKNVEKYSTLLPHICHYYILYVHPYFDYNGRTARMVSFWLNCILDITDAPLYMSEAINESKTDYYKAITNTRTTNNDLTYFLGYILETAIKYNFVYKNLEEIKNKLAKDGDFLSPAQLTYLKKIIIHNPEDYFNYRMFINYINVKMSKQAGLKVLNLLADYGVLEKTTNKRNEAIYRVNQEFITYKFSK